MIAFSQVEVVADPTVSFSTVSIDVPAGGSASFTVTIAPPASLPGLGVVDLTVFEFTTTMLRQLGNCKPQAKPNKQSRAHYLQVVLFASVAE